MPKTKTVNTQAPANNSATVVASQERSKTFMEAALNTPVVSQTNNGAATLQSSLSACVDLFFMIGASRGKNLDAPFKKALMENPDVATRVLLWARDARQGAGEREVFRSLLKFAEKDQQDELLKKVLPMVPELGRWDDLLIFKTEKWQHEAFALIAQALKDGNGLCAKWMPRQASKTDNTAHLLRNYLQMSPKQYRKTLVSLTQVVEQQMCAKDWSNIAFEAVPSVASARYSKAFERNAAPEYAAFKNALKEGTATINAQAIFPHDVIKAHFAGADKTIVDAQWQALPNYLGDEAILPMVDVSGSMSCPLGGKGSTTCLDAAVALGLYIAEKQQGAFKDAVLTFSHKTTIEVLKGSLVDKIGQLQTLDWGMNTNLERAFKTILSTAVQGNVAPEHMPKTLLILSDMEFDMAVRNPKSTLYENAQEQYEKAGYQLPKIVFWNLNARLGNVPVRFDERGTALVSGFSPHILKAILAAKEFQPEQVMLEAVMVPRYGTLEPDPQDTPKKRRARKMS